MTNSEFKALDRYDNGRLVNLHDVFYRLTKTQVDNLHGDDYSYYEELQEEVRYMHMESMKEFA